jgi:hypothetical protein
MGDLLIARPGGAPDDPAAWARIAAIIAGQRAAQDRLARELDGAAASMCRFRAVQLDVRCDQHGPMRYQMARDWWTCAGFDGEGCPVMVRAETIAAGTTTGPPDPWPGPRVTALGRWHLVPPPDDPGAT